MGMSPQQRYTLIYAPITKEHLRFIDKKYYSLIRDTIIERLSFEPTEQNRNRKPLTRPAFEEATWELRFGPENTFRVFYDVNADDREVYILAIGIKLRNTVYVGGEEITL
jgi:mRNA-degrading endonuclease RelE of RelBE toxin-antitoxin system